MDMDMDMGVRCAGKGKVACDMRVKGKVACDMQVWC